MYKYNMLYTFKINQDVLTPEPITEQRMCLGTFSRLRRSLATSTLYVAVRIPAERFLLYRKAISCKAKKTGNKHFASHLSYMFPQRQAVYVNAENRKITIPSTTSTTPVARFRVFGSALFANTAAILAQIKVKTTHRINTGISGIPPIAKRETAPVSAVNVIINTLVPTAVFSS